VLTDRESAWSALPPEVDVLVIGGGVTGAAIAHEAARRGLRTLLTERNDFASGTSSRSSKLIHGGLRYLKEGRFALTRESVHERGQLLRDAPGLVEPMPFLMPHYRGRKPSRATLEFGLTVYDALAGSWQHRSYDRAETLARVPLLAEHELQGAHGYLDATTDDARLVLRLLAQAGSAGATVLNYAEAALLFDGDRVSGAAITDRAGPARADVRARAVIAATGVFADELRARVDAPARLRPLRGSHLLIADWRLPLSCAVAFEHPQDGRPVFAYPWQGATLVGTTDIDHTQALTDPRIAPEEAAYLLAALAYQFPSAQIAPEDVISTISGVRPVVGEAGQAPSKASRDHVVWNERGLITITGGKLTTFRPMALDALTAAAPQLPPFDLRPRPVFEPCAAPDPSHRRLYGRFGSEADELLENAYAGELAPIGATPFLWAELRWSARREMVVRLDDLLLRRTRIGLLMRDGGAREFERIAAICRTELRWSQERWSQESQDYLARHREFHGMPHA
jgi:glycerol-3-phosphate dehydrogenase